MNRTFANIVVSSTMTLAVLTGVISCSKDTEVPIDSSPTAPVIEGLLPVKLLQDGDIFDPFDTIKIEASSVNNDGRLYVDFVSEGSPTLRQVATKILSENEESTNYWATIPPIYDSVDTVHNVRVMFGDEDNLVQLKQISINPLPQNGYSTIPGEVAMAFVTAIIGRMEESIEVFGKAAENAGIADNGTPISASIDEIKNSWIDHRTRFGALVTDSVPYVDPDTGLEILNIEQLDYLDRLYLGLAERAGAISDRPDKIKLVARGISEDLGFDIDKFADGIQNIGDRFGREVGYISGTVAIYAIATGNIPLATAAVTISAISFLSTGAAPAILAGLLKSAASEIENDKPEFNDFIDPLTRGLDRLINLLGDKYLSLPGSGVTKILIDNTKRGFDRIGELLISARDTLTPDGGSQNTDITLEEINKLLDDCTLRLNQLSPESPLLCTNNRLLLGSPFPSGEVYTMFDCGDRDTGGGGILATVNLDENRDCKPFCVNAHDGYK